MPYLPALSLLAALWLLPTTACCASVAESTSVQASPSEVAADAIAARIRAAEAMESSPGRKVALCLVAADAAVLIANISQQDPLWRRLQIDRMYALNLADEQAAVVSIYDEIVTRGIAIPSYVAIGAAEALFAIGRKAEAERVLLEVAGQAPSDPGPIIRLAYLLADDGRQQEAQAHLQDWLVRSKANSEATNANRLAAALVQARLQRWDEAFAASQAQLKMLAAAYPNEPSIRIEQAALQRQRGQPRAALATLDGLDTTQAREMAAQAWLDLGRPDQAIDLSNTESSPVRARAERQQGTRGRVSLEYANTRSPAITSPSGADEAAVSLRIDGPLLADTWRIGAQASGRQAQFRGSEPEARYAGVRVSRQSTGGEASFEFGQAFDDFLASDYSIAEAHYWLRDDWRVAARLAFNDPEGSLQARASGIGLDSLALSATYRPDETWRLDIGTGTAKFDDNNRRVWGSLSAERRLRADSTSATTAFASVYASRNSLNDAAYFNPRHDASTEFGLIHRFNSNSRLSQSLRPSLTRYLQDSQQARWIPRLTYSLRFAIKDDHWLQCDLGAAQPVYDSQREMRWWLSLAYGWGD